jgi:hypothetical protein
MLNQYCNDFGLLYQILRVYYNTRVFYVNEQILLQQRYNSMNYRRFNMRQQLVTNTKLVC